MSRVLLSARGLHLSFGGVRAAVGVDLEVRASEFLAIVGPNGAGKTTFLNMVTGYLKPQAGEIALLDNAPAAWARAPSSALALRGLSKSHNCFLPIRWRRMWPSLSPHARGCGPRCGRSSAPPSAR